MCRSIKHTKQTLPSTARFFFGGSARFLPVEKRKTPSHGQGQRRNASASRRRSLLALREAVHALPLLFTLALFAFSLLVLGHRGTALVPCVCCQHQEEEARDWMAGGASLHDGPSSCPPPLVRQKAILILTNHSLTRPLSIIHNHTHTLFVHLFVASKPWGRGKSLGRVGRGRQGERRKG